MEETVKLADILQGDLADHIIPDGRKVMMNQVSGTLRNALMSKRQSVRVEAKPVHGIREIFTNLEVFVNSYNIVHLNLKDVIIRNKGCQMLSEYLPRCPFLAHLNLGGNGIGDEGVGRLAAVLGQCASLAHLDLGWNWIGDEGVGRLAAVLGQCASLAHLDLVGNRIGAEGAGRLAAVLPRCASLARLDLRANEKGARRLAAIQSPCTVLF